MRKQLLLGTTALVVGTMAVADYAVAEEPLRLDVRGYRNEFFGVGDYDIDGASDRNNTQHFSDGEVHFKGETTLDNGLSVGVQVELEAFASGDQIDENYAWVKGDFGKINLGSENLSNYNTFWGVTAPGVGIPLNSGWITVFTPGISGLGFRAPGLTTNVTLGNDENTISYYSPRFSGFQLTLGYIPTINNSGDGSVAPADESSEYHNGIGVGFNFSESFNGVDIGLAAGYNRASAPDVVEALGGDDLEQFKVGASVGFGGFSIGGSYAEETEGRLGIDTEAFVDAFIDAIEGGAGFTTAAAASASTSLSSSEGKAWDLGVSYATGPWGVSATYFHGEQEGSLTTAGENEVDAYVGAVSYALGPGITASFSLYHGDFEAEGGAEADSTVGILGLAISY